jgi:hypothetical protein
VLGLRLASRPSVNLLSFFYIRAVIIRKEQEKKHTHTKTIIRTLRYVINCGNKLILIYEGPVNTLMQFQEFIEEDAVMQPSTKMYESSSLSKTFLFWNLIILQNKALSI